MTAIGRKFSELEFNLIENFGIEFSRSNDKGEEQWLRLYGRKIFDEQGDIHIVGTTQDITELMAQKIETYDVKRKLESVLHNAPGIFYQLRREPDGSLSIPYVSPKISELYGITPDYAAKKKNLILDLLHPDDKESYLESLEESLETLSQRTWEGRFVISGKSTWIRAVSTPYREPDGTTIWNGIVTDISEQKRLEEKLKQAEIEAFASNRLAALGQMAGSIAHEMNNPIFIIDGYAKKLQMLLRSNTATEEVLVDGLDRIHATCRRMAKTVKGMLQLARQKPNEPLEFASIESIVRDTLNTCEAFLKSKGVELRLHIDPGLSILCRPTEISQVLLNLFNNADDAIEEQTQKWIKIETKRSGTEVVISVTDSGPGLDPKVREKIMTPFFTTKPVGKGTGLGLSICRNIIEAHHGRLVLNSSGPNTCFEIRLPYNLSRKQDILAPLENQMISPNI